MHRGVNVFISMIEEGPNRDSFIFQGVDVLRYHHEKPDKYSSLYGITYRCNHPVYDSCTLFKIGKRGLAVIQQRYDPETKYTWWGEIDPWFTDLLCLHSKFKQFFDDRAGEPVDNFYPTVTIRQIMWALKNETNQTRAMGNLL